MAREINAAGLELIKDWEGCLLRAYPDVAGIWTIGYGHIRGVVPGMTITQAEADATLADDLASSRQAVDSTTSDVRTTDNQFGAMVALCFNIGSANFRGSTVLREHRSGNGARAAEAFLMWNKSHVNGVLREVVGLTNRRNAERLLYLSP
jgi:lysozyme